MNCHKCHARTRVVHREERSDGAHRWRRCVSCDSLQRTIERPFNGSRVVVRTSPKTSGELNANSILTEADVRLIRERYAAGVSRSVLATRFGMSKTTIAEIVTFKSWRHLT